LLPNIITASSLFLGFLAMKWTIAGRLPGGKDEDFIMAAYAILGATIADGLDGSVARLTRTQSQFGVQLDSLCDLVSFGVAPAILMYNFTLHQFGRLGFAVCFLFALCGALRLARFNVMASKGKASGNFAGIPIPMAAIPVCVCCLAYFDVLRWTAEAGIHESLIRFAEVLTTPNVRNWVFASIMFALSLGMISTFEYFSTKNLRLPRKKPFRVLALVLICLVMFFTLEFTLTMAILMLLYCLHGPVLWLFLKRDKGHDEDEVFTSGVEGDEA
jgi:CDP-diacylglycerol---serine O-phosphatidyltransferase